MDLDDVILIDILWVKYEITKFCAPMGKVTRLLWSNFMSLLYVCSNHLTPATNMEWEGSLLLPYCAKIC